LHGSVLLLFALQTAATPSYTHVSGADQGIVAEAKLNNS
jgi:hypothetical protein